MRRETQNVLLVLFGGALLKIAFSGTYLRYVKPALFPWLVATGAVMVLLAGFAIIRDVAGRPPIDHDEHGSRSPWMLLLPVFAIFLVAPPALGADSVARAGDRAALPQAPSHSLFPPLPPGNVPRLSLSEFVTRAVWNDRDVTFGRSVRLQGFVVHLDGASRTQLARMRISCCAADAAPVKVNLAGPAAGQLARLPADSWLEVAGALRPGSPTEGNGQTPTVDITEVHVIPAPRDPYEY